MQSVDMLGGKLVEGLALYFGELDLLGARLARTVRSSESTGAPGGAASDLRQVGEDGEGVLVSEGDVNEAMVGESGHGSEGCRLLAAAHGAGGDEEAGKLAVEATLGPLAASSIPEGLRRATWLACHRSVLEFWVRCHERLEPNFTYLPLGGEVPVPGGDTEEESVVLLEGGRAIKDGHIRILRGGVHLAKNLVRERLGDPTFATRVSSDSSSKTPHAHYAGDPAWRGDTEGDVQVVHAWWACNQ